MDDTPDRPAGMWRDHSPKAKLHMLMYFQLAPDVMPEPWWHDLLAGLVGVPLSYAHGYLDVYFEQFADWRNGRLPPSSATDPAAYEAGRRDCRKFVAEVEAETVAARDMDQEWDERN